MKKRGLAIIYDPQSLLQFIWYYCTYNQDIEWDSLCLPNGFKGEYMSEYCEKTQIFGTVFKDDTEYLNSSSKDQITIFLKMFRSAITKKQKRFCKEFLSRFVDCNLYDSFVVLTDHGLISGMIMQFADEKHVIVMEDGIGDYMYRANKNLLKHWFSAFDWKGFLVAKMGYANVGHRYPLKTTKNCIKFCSHIDMMEYKDYKEMLQVYDYSSTNMELYSDIINLTYGDLDKYDFNNIDTVLFSCNLADYISDTNTLRKRTLEYLSNTSINVLIKKHPRDIMEYNLEQVKTAVFDSRIPGEVLLPYIKGKRLVFMQISSLLLLLNDKDYKIECLYYKGLYESSKRETTYFNYPSFELFSENLQTYKLKNIKIVKV